MTENDLRVIGGLFAGAFGVLAVLLALHLLGWPGDTRPRV